MPGRGESNRGLVIDALRRNDSASRQDLVRETGLSRATLVKLLPELISAGLVVEHAGGSSPRVGSGRRPTLLSLDPTAGAIACIAFRGESVEVALADMSAQLLGRRILPMNVPFTPASEAFDRATEAVESVLGDEGLDPGRVVAAGVSIPAPIETRRGPIHATGILKAWADTDPAHEMSRRLGVPAIVDNDANVGARGELRYGAGRGRPDFIYVLLSAGIGAALVLDGRLYRGATGLAGELAHVVVNPDGPLCRCGNRGCLATAFDLRWQQDLLRPLMGEVLDLDSIVGLIRDRDRATLGMARDAGAVVGRALADACNLLNPSAIILGGELAIPESPFADALRRSIDRFSFSIISEAVEVVFGELGDRAELLGLAAMVIEDLERVPSSSLIPLKQVVEGATPASQAAEPSEVA